MNTPLRDKIANEIRQHGPIRFSRYMEMCLYEPGLGYYARPKEQFGKAGDFYTSSDVHALYGRLLCRQFDEIWRALGHPEQIDFVEFGPGRGLFALDVMDWAAKKFPAFYDALQYRLVETSEWLRQRQQERLQTHFAAGKVHQYATVADAGQMLGGNVIFFGNEFFDALPVEVVTPDGEIHVNVTDGGDFYEVTQAERSEVAEYIDRYSVHPEAGGRVEVGLAAWEYMGKIAALLKQRNGCCIFVDYGYTREEQFAGRHLDTLLTYREHTTSPNPFEAPGDQDITAHVNFTALQAAAAEHGIESLGLVTQSQLLMAVGEETQFADAFSECKLPQEQAKVALQLKHLVTPAGIGEVFQVLVLGKGIGRGDITGLKFAR